MEMANPRLFDRAVIRLSPDDGAEDVRAFLQGLVTQDSGLVSPETPLWGALLTPQGKALFDFFLFGDADAPGDILIDCEADRANTLAKRLMLYRLRRKIKIAVDGALGVFWGRDDSEAPTDPRLADLGHRWLAPLANDDEDVSAEYHAHRLSLGVTEGVGELGDGQTLWLECNAIELSGVSFTKGCYVGQENTARMNWRAKINRRMVVVPMAGADTKRQRRQYEDLALSVEHRPIADMQGLSLPAWQAQALHEAEESGG